MYKKAGIVLFVALVLLLIWKLKNNYSTETEIYPDPPKDILLNKNNIKESVTKDQKEKVLGDKPTDEELVTPAMAPANEQKNSLDKMETYFDNIEKNWIKNITDLFKEELDLDDAQLQAYLNLREEYENERLEKYELYHERLIKEHGPDFKFHISEEEMQEEVRELNLKYRDKLRETIGDENYVRYLEFRDRFNEKIKTDDHIEFSGLEINF